MAKTPIYSSDRLPTKRTRRNEGVKAAGTGDGTGNKFDMGMAPRYLFPPTEDGKSTTDNGDGWLTVQRLTMAVITSMLRNRCMHEEDVSSDVVLRLWEQRNQHAYTAEYIKEVARNEARDHLKNRSIHPASLDSMTGLDSELDGGVWIDADRTNNTPSYVQSVVETLSVNDTLKTIPSDVLKIALWSMDDYRNDGRIVGPSLGDNYIRNAPVGLTPAMSIRLNTWRKENGIAATHNPLINGDNVTGKRKSGRPKKTVDAPNVGSDSTTKHERPAWYGANETLKSTDY